MPRPIWAGVFGMLANDFAVLEKVGEHLAVGAGDNRDDKLVRPEVAAELVADLGEGLGLDGEKDHVGIHGCVQVRRRPAHAVLARQFLTPVGPRSLPTIC